MKISRKIAMTAILCGLLAAVIFVVISLVTGGTFWASVGFGAAVGLVGGLITYVIYRIKVARNPAV